MKILITNDDGYFAKGIKTLAKTLSKNHDVRIVAPMSERSGSSHSVSFSAESRTKIRELSTIFPHLP